SALMNPSSLRSSVFFSTAGLAGCWGIAFVERGFFTILRRTKIFFFFGLSFFLSPGPCRTAVFFFIKLFYSLIPPSPPLSQFINLPQQAGDSQSVHFESEAPAGLRDGVETGGRKQIDNLINVIVHVCEDLVELEFQLGPQRVKLVAVGLRIAPERVQLVAHG